MFGAIVFISTHKIKEGSAVQPPSKSGIAETPCHFGVCFGGET
jgi:hypothetical protein